MKLLKKKKIKEKIKVMELYLLEHENEDITYIEPRFFTQHTNKEFIQLLQDTIKLLKTTKLKPIK
jgi:hypothetical protein